MTDTIQPFDGFLTMESIQFQKDPRLYLGLIDAFTKLDLSKDNLQNVNASIQMLNASNIRNVIHEVTGVSVAIFYTWEGDSCAIIPPMIDKNHPLLNTIQRKSQMGDAHLEYTAKVIRNSEKDIGWVDLQNSRVHGVYAEMMFPLFIPGEFLLSNTPEKIASAIIHEVGHVFTFFTYVATFVQRNFALVSVSNTFMGQADKSAKVKFLMDVKREFNLPSLNVDVASEAVKPDIIHSLLLNSTLEAQRSELGCYLYDETAAEFLADQFAIRHGAGRELALGLADAYRGFNNSPFKSPALRFLQNVWQLVWVMFTTLITLGISAVLITSMAYSMHPMLSTYDRPTERIKRIRQQTIEGLKDPKLPPEIKKQLLSDAVRLGEIVDSMSNQRTLFETFFTAIFPKHRKQYNQLLLQKDLESIASNDLFVISEKFKQL